MKREPFFRSQVALVALATGGLCLMSEPSWAFGPRSVEANKSGLKQYSGENYHGAFKDFTEALAAEPFNPQLHLNLGDAFFKGGEYEKAIGAYSGVMEAPKSSDLMKFQALFNSGNAAFQAQKIPEALSFWQRSLSFAKDNPEAQKMAKTNIELALKEQKGGGGGGGQQQQKEDDKQDDKGKQGQNQKPQNQPQPKPKPQPFKSQELTESDVKRILEELKRQEQISRAKQHDNKKSKEDPPEKDW